MRENFWYLFFFFSIVIMNSVSNIIFHHFTVFFVAFLFLKLKTFVKTLSMKSYLHLTPPPTPLSSKVKAYPDYTFLGAIIFQCFLDKKNLYYTWKVQKKKKTYRKNDFKRKWLHTGSALHWCSWEALIKKMHLMYR